VSTDWIGFAAGDPNLMRYVGNGPMNFKDPTGKKRAVYIDRPGWDTGIWSCIPVPSLLTWELDAKEKAKIASLKETRAALQEVYTGVLEHEKTIIANGVNEDEVRLMKVNLGANMAVIDRYIRDIKDWIPNAKRPAHHATITFDFEAYEGRKPYWKELFNAGVNGFNEGFNVGLATAGGGAFGRSISRAGTSFTILVPSMTFASEASFAFEFVGVVTVSGRWLPLVTAGGGLALMSGSGGTGGLTGNGATGTPGTGELSEAAEEIRNIKLTGWSKGKEAGHYLDHAEEMGITSQTGYTAAAKQLAKKADCVIEQKVGNHLFKYDLATDNILIINGRNRKIKTFYKADNGLQSFREAMEAHLRVLCNQGH
jgi:hypothetical protein